MKSVQAARIVSSVCIAAGTTTELNLCHLFQGGGDDSYTAADVRKTGPGRAGLSSGPLPSLYSTDMSSLYSAPGTAGQARATMSSSRKPSPRSRWDHAVRQDDAQWFTIVEWVHFALLNAEELGMTQDNVDQTARLAPIRIWRLLGNEGDFR